MFILFVLCSLTKDLYFYNKLQQYYCSAFLGARHLGSNFQARCHARTYAELMFFFLNLIIYYKIVVKVQQKELTTRLTAD